MGNFAKICLSLLVLLTLPLGARAQSVLGMPFDPVIGLKFQPKQIAFEIAPKALVEACTQPRRKKFWIYAQTDRPEGVYMVIAGPIWITPDTTTPSKPELELNDPYESVVLVKNGICRTVADPDTLFSEPGAQQAQIVDELAKDLIKRAMRAYGGPSQFLKALRIQGLSGDKLDAVIQPLVDELPK